MPQAIASRLAILLIAFCACLPAIPAHAHPGWGIVRDAQGNIYYTDLAQVWMIAPDGSRRVVVPDVHTHELHLDAAGNLYGEHLWYEGEASDRWGHRVWRRSPNGQVTDVVGPTEGFRSDYSFVRDAAGNMYWADAGVVRVRAPDGRSRPLTGRRFAQLRSMTASPAGEIYLIDGGDLLRIGADGSVTRLAAALGQASAAMPLVGGHHQLMGIWLDPQGRVYVAVFGGQMVKRIDPRGSVEVVARSTAPWSPTGGLVAPDGRLWLLEYSLTNEARVRMAEAPEPGRPATILSLVAAGGLLAALPLVLIWRSRRRRRVEHSVGPR